MTGHSIQSWKVAGTGSGRRRAAALLETESGHRQTSVDGHVLRGYWVVHTFLGPGGGTCDVECNASLVGVVRSRLLHRGLVLLRLLSDQVASSGFAQVNPVR